MDFQNNIKTWEDTVKRCDLFASQNIYPDKSIKYNFIDISIQKKYTNTFVKVVNTDCIKVALELLNNGLNPVVLNLADDRFPGGHVEIGSGAQEESLFRRTNYFQTLNHKTGFYPLVESQLVYSPKVTIIKDENNNILSNYKDLAFIACPALHDPELIDGKLKDTDTQILENKIKNILNVSYKHGHDVVILGALGCGAWKCPPICVASIYKKVIQEYDGLFRSIIFAVLEVNDSKYIVRNRNKTESNYNIFSSELN